MFGQSFGGSGFGQNNAFQSNNNNMSNNLFGSNTGMNQVQAQPAAFGSTAPTQSTGLFGQASQPATSGFGGFGQPQQQTNNAFGQSQQGSSLFGAKPSPFGTSTNTGGVSSTPAFGATSGTNMTGSGQGTAAVPFQARQEPEPSKPTSTNIYQSITAMPQYSNFSFEELRWQDYQQNRRYGDGNTGGTATAFGGAPSTPFNAGNTSTGFGFGAQNQNQTSTFGQPAASNSSPFGQSTTNTGTGMFGQSSSSPFGQPKAAFGFGANTQTNTTGSGLFGSNTMNNNSPFGQNNTNTGTTGSTFGGFGQTNQNTNTTGSTFGGFGQSTNTNTGGSLFGQSNPSTGGMFGQSNNTASTSGGLFGQKPAGTSMFGQANNTGTTTAFGQPASGGGLFGANSSTNNTNSSGGLFGQKPAGSSLFGQTNNTTTFGQTNNTTGGFGFGQANTNTTNTSGGLFGNNTNSAQPSGGLFGANNANSTTNTFGQPNSSGGLFGNTANNTSNTSGGLFGAKPATNTFGQTNTGSGGLFGSNTNTTAANSGSTIFGGNSTNTASTGTGLFGQSKPATGGLFGSQPATNTTTSTGTGLFGQSNTSSTGTGLFGSTANTSTTTPASTFGNTSTTGGGLFGNKPAGTTSLFGSTQPSTTATTGAAPSMFGKPAGTTSLFGQPANGQATTQQPSALGGSLFGGSAANTAPAFGALGAQQPGQPSQSLVATIQQNPYGNNPLFNNVPVPESKTGSFATALTTTPTPRKRLDPLLAFKTRPRRVKPVSGTSSPTASSNTTASVEAPTEKELLLYNEKTDKLILRSEQFAPRLSALRRLVLDSRADDSELPSVSAIPESASVDLQAAASSTPPRKSGLESANVSATANSTIPAAAAVVAADMSSLPDNEQIDENGYWISPSQSKLDHMSVKELESVEHFRIGRKDIGFVTFDAPVDLSGFSNVRKQAGGHLIVFADRMFALYPQDKDCPPPGKGFNVPATVTLYNLWVKAKDTNQPIKDRNNGLCKRQLKRLKQFPGTKFVSWDPETGTWVFNLEPREPVKS
ncbi:hypothetical protein B9G98_02173 [Wickerhamiella sorbophila]|uniref:Peptidase S59 domain-containing protein n=1 Tax=Wickerhamiella sorbophila TaxID=45607 RepID=A0A2T0FHS6_9ASCO|nr:hypothetical protein B9G98_02173 [Wickerhamiella sorbophila]PRT54553.1 hypothetical protein B9G98_02173 [Wickerhamiella sorbophila]